jgi:hypothetical protein
MTKASSHGRAKQLSTTKPLRPSALDARGKVDVEVVGIGPAADSDEEM